MVTQDEFNQVMSDYDKQLIEDDKARWRNAPKCHFRPMEIVRDDEETYWECSVCEHTKSIY